MANLDVEDCHLLKVGHLKFQRNDLPEFKLAVTAYPTGALREDLVISIGSG